MAGGVDGNAGRAIEKRVAIDIFDGRAGSPRDDERIAARVRRRDDSAVAIDEGFGVGTWKRCTDVGDGHKVKSEKLKVKS